MIPIFAFMSLIYINKRYKELSISLFQLLSISSFTIIVNVFNIEIASVYQIVMYLMILISIVDLKEKIIPKSSLVLLLFLPLFNFEPLLRFELYIVLIFLMLITVISLVSNSIGFGDVKLLLVLLFLFGPEKFITILFYICFIITSYSIYLLLFRKKTKSYSFPMAPTIFLATSILILGG